MSAGNGRDGIWYSGSGATVFNNLVRGNGTAGGGDYGVTIFNGSGHKVSSNTIYGNVAGGLRLSTTATNPVLGAAVDNIIVANGVGVKEPAGSGYTADRAPGRAAGRGRGRPRGGGRCSCPATPPAPRPRSRSARG